MPRERQRQRNKNRETEKESDGATAGKGNRRTEAEHKKERQKGNEVKRTQERGRNPSETKTKYAAQFASTWSPGASLLSGSCFSVPALSEPKDPSHPRRAGPGTARNCN